MSGAFRARARHLTAMAVMRKRAVSEPRPRGMQRYMMLMLCCDIHMFHYERASISQYMSKDH